MFYGDDDDTNEVRYKFEQRGTNELIIIGINPSMARGESKTCPKWIDDPTVDRAIAFAANNWNYDDTKQKFDGFLMLNVCAQSTSNTADLVRDDKLHSTNIEKIKTYLVDKSFVYVLLSYGNSIDDTKKPWLKDYLKDIKAVLDSHGAKYFHLGTFTQKRNPRHICPRPTSFKDIPITAELNPM